MELLIIDEISMVRCDLLDVVDALLRAFRRRYDVAFGGVQVILIGDTFQLPPIATGEEWEILKQYYSGPFFFNSKVIEENQPIYIELKKIYRQKEQDFIDLLNHVRVSQMLPDEYNVLNSKYNPKFTPSDEDNYIILATTNKAVESYNVTKLSELKTGKADFYYQKSREAIKSASFEDGFDNLIKAVKYRNDIETEIFKKYFVTTASRLYSYVNKSQMLLSENIILEKDKNDIQTKLADKKDKDQQFRNKIKKQNDMLGLMLEKLQQSEINLARSTEKIKDLQICNSEYKDKILLLEDQLCESEQNGKNLQKKLKETNDVRWYQKLFGKK
ncbi:MAG: AAA family ATPase [Bacteroidales bacterium]|jgi:hypothetical protein|nr:AAA family ATPase [Bacteroidales bacterium]MDD3152079.1 AAA family ATPase [Bacteroidales bacterium]MDD3913217.1 AAA family ATPase [Bacteroidales bacterium]MDD4633132.1 AAA family ATPase [Bacteroidales bacterium]